MVFVPRTALLVLLMLGSLSVLGSIAASPASDDGAVAIPRGSSVAVASSHAFVSAPTPVDAMRASDVLAHASPLSMKVATDASTARVRYVAH